MRPRRSPPTTSTRAAKRRSGWQIYPRSSPRRPGRATASTTTLPPTLSPPRSRLASAGALDERGRTETGQDLDQHHLATIALDDLVADDLIAGVVPTLHQHARLYLRNQFDRGVFVEDCDEIDRLQRRQHFRARALVLHRTSLTFQPLHRRVTVQADNQAVAGAPRRGQDLDVAGMQNIEAAIGESDP